MMTTHQVTATIPCVRWLVAVGLCLTVTGSHIASAQSTRTDETQDFSRSLSSSTTAIANFSRQCKQQFDSGYRDLQAIQLEIERAQSSPSRAAAELKRLIAELRTQTSGLEAKITEIQVQVKRLAEQQQELEAMARRMNEVLPKLLDAVRQNQDADKAQLTLTAISRDRDKVARLLAAIKGSKHAEALTVITAGAVAGLQSGTGVAGSWTGVGTAPRGVPTAAIVATQMTGGAKIVFRLGSLLHCVGIQNACSGLPYTISK